jgi:hypothetical protein
MNDDVGLRKKKGSGIVRTENGWGRVTLRDGVAQLLCVVDVVAPNGDNLAGRADKVGHGGE